MENRSLSDASFHVVETSSAISDSAASAWSMPIAVKDSALATGAVLGGALVFLAARGKGPALAHIFEPGGTIASGARQFMRAEERTAHFLSQSVRQEPQAVLEMSANDAVTTGSTSTLSVESKLSSAFGGPAKPFEYKQLQELAKAEDEIVSQALKKGKIQDAAGEVIKRPGSGEALSSNERFYANYIDAMPIKNVPEYLETGRLVPGIYRMRFDEFAREFGTGARRQNLLANFEPVLQDLRRANVDTVHVAGSFVTKKANPGDIDFFWDKLANTHKVDYGLLFKNRDGELLRQAPARLRAQGLHLLVEPVESKTYKGMQYFFSHHGAPVASRGPFGPTIGRFILPNGIVELDLSTMLNKSVAARQAIAA